MSAFSTFKAGSRIVTTEDAIMNVITATVTNMPIVREVEVQRAQRTHQELFMRGIALLFDIPSHCGDILPRLEAGECADFPSVEPHSESHKLLTEKIQRHAVQTKQVTAKQSDDTNKTSTKPLMDVGGLCLNYMSILQYAELFKPNREPIRAIFSYLFKLHNSFDAVNANQYSTDETKTLDAYYAHLHSRYYTADKFLLRMKHLMQIFMLPNMCSENPLYLDTYLVAIKSAVHFQGDKVPLV
jgi:hypothetical protein